MAGNPWLEERVAVGELSRVRPNVNRAGDLVNQARTHIASARVLADTDPTLAIAACHDSIRKAIDAHCGATGYRIENRPGAHRRAIEYAAEVLGTPSDDVAELDRVRQRRHQAECGEAPAAAFSPAEIEHAAALASRVVSAVAASLAAAST